MNTTQTILAAFLGGFFFLSPSLLPAQEGVNAESVKNTPDTIILEIGDPKEIFLSKKREIQWKQTSKSNTKHDTPQSMDEFIAYLKEDFNSATKELKRLKGEIVKQQRNTFTDPEFTPPKRPDWR